MQPSLWDKVQMEGGMATLKPSGIFPVCITSTRASISLLHLATSQTLLVRTLPPSQKHLERGTSRRSAAVEYLKWAQKSLQFTVEFHLEISFISTPIFALRGPLVLSACSCEVGLDNYLGSSSWDPQPHPLRAQQQF